MNTIEIKRGDTLYLQCTVQDGGQGVDISGWQIECWLRANGGQVVHQFTPEILDAAAGRYSLSATAEQTNRWRPGSLSADIRYTDAAGVVRHTATWPLRVLQSITER